MDDENRNMCKIFIASGLIFVACLFNSNSEEYPEEERWQELPAYLSFVVKADDRVSEAGSLLKYRIILTNNSNYTIVVGAGKSLTPNTFEFDLEVLNKEKKMVWSRFPKDAIYHSIMYNKKLDPGENLSMDGTWSLKNSYGQPVSPGNYFLFGGLHLVEISVLDSETNEKIKKIDFGPDLVRSTPIEVEIY